MQAWGEGAAGAAVTTGKIEAVMLRQVRIVMRHVVERARQIWTLRVTTPFAWKERNVRGLDRWPPSCRAAGQSLEQSCRQVTPKAQVKMADLRCPRIDLDEFGGPASLIDDEIEALQP